MFRFSLFSLFSLLVFSCTSSILCMDSTEKRNLLLVVKNFEKNCYKITSPDKKSHGLVTEIFETNIGSPKSFEAQMFFGKKKEQKKLLYKLRSNKKRLTFHDVKKNQEIEFVPVKKQVFQKTISHQKRMKLAQKIFPKREANILDEGKITRSTTEEGKITLKAKTKQNKHLELTAPSATLGFMKKHFPAFCLLFHHSFDFPLFYFKKMLQNSKIPHEFFEGNFTLKSESENCRLKQTVVKLRVCYE